ncbi:hypothetical protein HK097_010913 [Rhizophlyctis rosea]|uniref:Organic hydroperoxide resistance protein n=1 Tax=Rhizophlyctis rosea TaxID=64517 RepID=A0AAD5S9C0_9FUNG|nr:hypothetical protein HK097_010913 [Rhizophlyctis rosea]
MFRPTTSLILVNRAIRTARVAPMTTRSFSSLYKTDSTATGEGRAGHVKNSEGFAAEMVLPKGLGGPGNSGQNVNPEILFASGYASCFLGALRATAGNQKVKLPGNTSVNAAVELGKVSDGFKLKVDLTVNTPGLDKSTAEKVVKGAHEMCPYSKATRGNIDVSLKTIV